MTAARALLLAAGLAWLGVEVYLVVVGIEAAGLRTYVDSGNAPSVVTASPFLAVGAWHIWSDRRHQKRHNDMKAHIECLRHDRKDPL